MNPNKRRHTSDDKENIYPEKRPRMALYLLDNTPIRTIEVLDIGDDISAEYLRGYFESVAGFKRVSNVRIAGRNVEGNPMIRVAYVTFLLPEDAAMLLCDENTPFEIRFTIRPADRAYQPKIDPTVLKFEDINDRCLLHIASYLPPMDLVNLGRTCKRLKSIVVQIYQKKSRFSGYRNEAQSVSEKYLPIVLQDMGPYIGSIDWKWISLSELLLLTEHCSNVNRMRLRYPSLSSNEIHTARPFFKNIKSLTLQDCSSLYDNSMTMIITSSNLRKLQLIDCLNMRGKFFNQWEDCQLSHLTIYDCPAVRNIVLKVGETGRLDTLIQLDLDCNELDAHEIEKLQCFKNVRHLTLRRVNKKVAKRVYSLLHKYLPKVEKLCLLTKNDKLNQKSISDMVSSLANLTYFSYSSMSWELLHKIHQVREIGKQPRIKIGISREMFNDPKKMAFAAAAKNVIKMTLMKERILRCF